jgi:hypothetical protein
MDTFHLWIGWFPFFDGVSTLPRQGEPTGGSTHQQNKIPKRCHGIGVDFDRHPKLENDPNYHMHFCITVPRCLCAEAILAAPRVVHSLFGKILSRRGGDEGSTCQRQRE